MFNKYFNIERQYFCWVNHADKIFCCQENYEGSKESRCCLFNKQGVFVETVYLLDYKMYSVKSANCCKETLEVCLNVFNRNNYESKSFIFNELFSFIKSIDHNLLNPQFSLSYTSNI